MTSAQLLPAIIIPLIGWRIYMRVRRNVGRQPFHQRRWRGAVIVFTAVTAFLGYMARGSPTALGGLGGGSLIGAALAWLAFRLTRWESTPEGNFYTPNTVIGLGVTLLFIGRIAYRFIVVLGMTAAERADATSAMSYSNPFTLLTFGITAGFYIAFNAGLLLHAHKKV
jgi:hypothetical protein